MLAFTIAWRVFKSLRNDKRTIALIVIAPVLIMIVFGFAFAGDLKGVRLIVVSKDPLLAPEMIAMHIDGEMFKVEPMEDPALAEREVREGRAWAAVVIPQDFSLRAREGRASVQLYVDRSNVLAADRITAEIAGSFSSLARSFGLRPLVTQNITYVYGGEAGFMDAFMPGVVSIAIFFLSIFLTLVSFVVERRSHTLYRLYATPVRELDIVLGYSLAFSIIAAFQVVELFTVSILLFEVKVRGNILYAIAAGSLLAVSGVNLGLLLSGLVRNEAQAPQVMPMVTLPSILLSGVFWPIEAIPELVRPLSYLVPPTYAIEAIRAIVIKGWGITEIGRELGILALFASIFMLMSVMALRRRD
ncbi:MAG: ABC transporter permease [Acidilobaceae archaeon]|nr:ABC transporter permease [Acidilobaceae archaeon]MCX8165922.1 ABC transporter permease [Acidilobaceae archaeon]MDW7974565.1 ABC transporter permease [Sulfolobales archaeon]